MKRPKQADGGQAMDQPSISFDGSGGTRTPRAEEAGDCIPDDSSPADRDRPDAESSGSPTGSSAPTKPSINLNSGSAQVVRIVPFALVDADDDPLSDFKIVEKALARTEGEIDTKDRGALLARICGRYLLARPNPAELSDDDATEVFRLLERRTGVRLIIVHGTSFVPVYGIEVLAEVIDLLARGATETAGKTEGTSTDTTVDGER